MIRTILLGLMFLASSPAHSGEAEVRVYRLNGKEMRLVRHATGVFSRSCVKTDGTLDCTAARAIKHASYSILPPRIEGRNPGAMICKALGGAPAVAIGPMGEEDAFCGFEDNSAVACASLTRAASVNDAKGRGR